MNDRTAIINGDKIEIAFSYDMRIIQAVKDIQGREWNKPAHPGVWIVPVSPWHMARVVEVLKPFKFYIDPDIIKGADAKAETPKLKLPKGLYKYQKQGVEFIHATGGRCIVGDVMGLGKTAQALVFANQFCDKTLIIAPASVIMKWATKECSMWAPDRKVQVILKGKDEIEPDSEIVIMSYGIMVSKYEQLSQTPFTCVIFDEAHALKSHKSQRGRIAKALVKAGIPHVLFLSGTPYMNRPVEMFPLLNMLEPKLFSNFYHFAARYAGWQYMEGMWVRPEKDIVTNPSELAKRLESIMLRRTKDDVALELPALTRSYLPVTIENMADYNVALKDVRKWYADRGEESVNPNHTLTRLNVLRQIVGHGKTSAAIELAEDILDSEERVVLFAHHKEVIKSLASALHKYGVGVISGDTPTKQRQELIQQFLNQTLNHKNKIRVMLISTAGAEGIDLYSASNLIMVEREWTPAKEEQIEARLHRIGQHKNVTVHYLVASNTVDDKFNEIVEHKRKMFGDVIRQDEVLVEIMESM